MIDIPAELKSCIRVQGNKIYVLSNYRAHPLFLSFKKKYREDGEVTVVPVSSEELYNIADDNVLNDPEVKARVVELYSKILKSASLRRASDIHIVLYKQSHANIYFRINGKLTRTMQITEAECDAIMRSIYQTITMSDVSYKEFEYQAGQIHNFDIADLPENIHSIRIQRGPVMHGLYMTLRLLYKDEGKLKVLKKIGEILVEKKFITKDTLGIALNIQKDLRDKGQYVKLGDILIKNGFITKNVVEEVLHSQKGLLEFGIETFKNYGYTEEQSSVIVKAARQPQGMVVFSGPTGSGKSTALKYALEFQYAMYPDKSIYTIEDPPEYPINGAKQLYVLNANTDDVRESKFAEGLRVAMRSDPDILMVGEIRDAATANVAIDAVITGHQMWTTIHAIDVFAIISRLLRFGINKDDLLDEKLLNVLVGQRLLPRLCDHCKIDFAIGNFDKDLFNFLSAVDNGNIRLANPAGCEKCNYTGISGRVVVAEVLEVTGELIEDIKNLGLQAVRRELNSTGMTIMKHALSRILNGEVDIRDVTATCGDITKEANIYV